MLVEFTSKSFIGLATGQLKNLFLVKVLEKHLDMEDLIFRAAIVKNKFNNHILHLSLSLSLLPLSLSLPPSFSLFLTGEEGVRTPAISACACISIPHSVSQSACVIIRLISCNFRFLCDSGRI